MSSANEKPAILPHVCGTILRKSVLNYSEVYTVGADSSWHSELTHRRSECSPLLPAGSLNVNRHRSISRGVTPSAKAKLERSHEQFRAYSILEMTDPGSARD